MLLVVFAAVIAVFYYGQLINVVFPFQHAGQQTKVIPRFYHNLITTQDSDGSGGVTSSWNTTLPCATGRPCTYTDVVDLRVITITFNRPDSLLKLLQSLDTLVLDGHTAALEIWIDRDREGRVHDSTVALATKFKWKGGPTRVHVQVIMLCTANNKSTNPGPNFQSFLNSS